MPEATKKGLVLALHQQVQQRIRVDHGLPEVGHHANQVPRPLILPRTNLKAQNRQLLNEKSIKTLDLTGDR